jgi:hypothetical protein
MGEPLSPRDLDEWQRALEVAEADLREREAAVATEELTEQELRAFAAEHDKLALDRDALADARDDAARSRDRAALDRDVRGSVRDRAARSRQQDLDEGFADRFQAGADRDLAAGDRSDSVDDRQRSAQARRAAAGDRQRAADERDSAANRQDGLHRELVTLRAALDSRLQIGQAEGLLMARHGLDPDAAFKLLVKLSQEGNRKLRDVAARLVADAAGQRTRRAPQ